MISKEIHQDYQASLLRKKSTFLILEFSHICLALPALSFSFYEESNQVILTLTAKDLVIPTKEWDSVFSLTFPYKIQHSDPFLDEEPILYKADLSSKEFFEDKIRLTFTVETPPALKSFRYLS